MQLLSIEADPPFAESIPALLSYTFMFGLQDKTRMRRQRAHLCSSDCVVATPRRTATLRRTASEARGVWQTGSLVPGSDKGRNASPRKL